MATGCSAAAGSAAARLARKARLDPAIRPERRAMTRRTISYMRMTGLAAAG